MGDNWVSFVFCESSHVEEGVMEELLPDVVDRCLNWFSGHRAVPPLKSGEKGFGLRIWPYLLEKSQSGKELREHFTQKPILKIELQVFNIFKTKFLFFAYFFRDEFIEGKSPACY
jgi:hypothetical protein